MREVRVIGTGMIRFGKYPEKTLADLAWPAVLQALAEAGVERRDVGAAWCGTALGGMMAGQRILKPLGMTSIPIANVENACASSATAFREGYIAVGAGIYDCALVIGAEKLTKLRGGPLPVEQEDWEASYGLMMPALYAMRARRYLHDHKFGPEVLAQVSVKARKHGVKNEDAQIQQEISLEEALASRPIAEPLRIADCCPTGDGAAAVVIASAEFARKLSRQGVRIASSTLNSGKFMTGFRDFTSPEITKRAAHEAYEAAGIGPEDVDLAEVHDAFSIAELLYYEALGFCAGGDAPKLLADGVTSLGGRIPVNPSGGLLSKGHPVGATGVAQIVEIVRQLENRAGGRQVDDAKVGMAHVTGGGISGLDHGACAIHIFAR
jgi:benzoylsuccinyl-CoA thiolase BbsB subunit